MGKEVANNGSCGERYINSRVRGLQAASFALGLVAGGSNVKRMCLWLAMPMLWCVVMCGGVWEVVSSTAVCILQCCGQAVRCGVCDTPELWCGAAGLCARVRACAGAAESLHTYIHLQCM